MRDFDALIIGSGQGGNPLSHKLADKGWEVALVEREHLGGTCVNTGCTPTKTMIESARVAFEARRAPGVGVETGAVRVNIQQVVARKRSMVEEWRSGQQKQAQERESLEVIYGHARFVEPRVVEVNGERLRGQHVFIDTGTRPAIPPIDGLEEVSYFTNRSIMEIAELPDHLVVLGGGYVGLEFAQMFRRFGSEVTVVQQASQLLPREDKDIASELHDILKEEGVDIHLGAKATAVRSRGSGGIELTVQGAPAVSGSHLLVAAGRRPNTDDLGLEKAGVETNDRGFIVVNERLETTADNTWAIGDVKGGPAFTHVSYNDHLVIHENLLENGRRSTKDRVIPYALFTDPELGRVGKTEREAREEGYEVKIGSVPVSSVARAKEAGRTQGMMKVVIDGATDRILGAAILAAGAGELVHVFMTLMLAGAPWTLLKRSMFIHPTYTEGFFALLESVDKK